jgi:hypothetical protein
MINFFIDAWEANLGAASAIVKVHPQSSTDIGHLFVSASRDELPTFNRKALPQTYNN